MRDLMYIKENQFIPWGRVSSTARFGDKWHKQADVGDVLRLCIIEPSPVAGEVDKVTPFGYAVVVAKELVTFEDVLANADHNHVAFDEKEVSLWLGSANFALQTALYRAYGDLKLSDTFTILHILRVNSSHVEDLQRIENRATLTDGGLPRGMTEDDVREHFEAIVERGKVDGDEGIDATEDVLAPWRDLVNLGLHPNVAAVEDVAEVGSMLVSRRVEFR